MEKNLRVLAFVLVIMSLSGLQAFGQTYYPVYAIAVNDCVEPDGTIGCNSPPPEVNCPSTCTGFQQGQNIVFKCTNENFDVITDEIDWDPFIGIPVTKYSPVEDFGMRVASVYQLTCHTERDCQCVPQGGGAVACETATAVSIYSLPTVAMSQTPCP